MDALVIILYDRPARVDQHCPVLAERELLSLVDRDQTELEIDALLPGQAAGTVQHRRLVLLKDDGSRFRPTDDGGASPGLTLGPNEEVVQPGQHLEAAGRPRGVGAGGQGDETGGRPV